MFPSLEVVKLWQVMAGSFGWVSQEYVNQQVEILPSFFVGKSGLFSLLKLENLNVSVTFFSCCFAVNKTLKSYLTPHYKRNNSGQILGSLCNDCVLANLHNDLGRARC